MITKHHPLTATERALSTFAAEVWVGLTKSGQKTLPSVYLYDELGSALFEAITKLPEYGLTRADERLLTTYARAIARRLDLRPAHVAELGSGSGRKTRPLLQALLAEGHELVYYPIDISASALEACRLELSTVAAVVPLESRYLDGLMQVTLRREEGEPLLVMFLGSTIGNFDREEATRFLESVRELLMPGDALLLGTDLVKPVRMIIDAYDDPTGVSAAFTLNLLGRVNRELGANFDLRQFRHEAIYNEAARRVEIGARALTRQLIRISSIDLDVDIAEGELILTEYSHKYTIQDLRTLAAQTGFDPHFSWIDHEWPFAESLWKVTRE
jgi:L-histidine Nalpha-methyltransferase